MCHPPTQTFAFLKKMRAHYNNAPGQLPLDKLKNAYKFHIPFQPRIGESWHDRCLYTPECFVHVDNIHKNIRSAFGQSDIDEHDIKRFASNVDGALEFLAQVKNEICHLIYKNCHVKIPTIDRNHAYLMAGLCRWRNSSDDSMFVDVIESDSVLLSGKWFKIVDKDFNKPTISDACDEMYDILKDKTEAFHRMIEEHHGLRIENLPKFLMSSLPPEGGMPNELYNLCSTCIEERVNHLNACIEHDPPKAFVHHVLIQIARDIDEVTRKRPS